MQVGKLSVSVCTFGGWSHVLRDFVEIVEDPCIAKSTVPITLNAKEFFVCGDHFISERDTGSYHTYDNEEGCVQFCVATNTAQACRKLQHQLCPIWEVAFSSMDYDGSTKRGDMSLTKYMLALTGRKLSEMLCATTGSTPTVNFGRCGSLKLFARMRSYGGWSNTEQVATIVPQPNVLQTFCNALEARVSCHAKDLVVFGENFGQPGLRTVDPDDLCVQLTARSPDGHDEMVVPPILFKVSSVALVDDADYPHHLTHAGTHIGDLWCIKLRINQKAKENKWFPASIVSRLEGDQYQIRFDDGDLCSIPQQYVRITGRSRRDTLHFHAGDNVEARFPFELKNFVNDRDELLASVTLVPKYRVTASSKFSEKMVRRHARFAGRAGAAGMIHWCKPAEINARVDSCESMPALMQLGENLTNDDLPVDAAGELWHIIDAGSSYEEQNEEGTLAPSKVRIAEVYGVDFSVDGVDLDSMRVMAPCAFCSQMLLKTDMKKHMLTECPDRKVACVNVRYGCPERNLKFRLKALHEQKCTYRTVQCTNEHCRQPVRCKNMAYHLEHECKGRIVTCKQDRHGFYGCGKRLIFKDLKNHRDKECIHRKVLCRDGLNSLKPGGSCNKWMRLSDRERHYKMSCPLTILPCGVKRTFRTSDTPNDPTVLDLIDTSVEGGEARRQATLESMYNESLKEIMDVSEHRNADIPQFCEDISVSRGFHGCGMNLCAKMHEHHRHWECIERKIRCRWLVSCNNEWVEHYKQDPTGEGRPAWKMFHRHIKDHETQARDLFLKKMKAGVRLTKYGRGGGNGHDREFVLLPANNARSQNYMKLQ